MADITNPEDIIAREGRLSARGYRRWPAITVANIDFDTLYGQLNTELHNVLRDFQPIRNYYDGTTAEINAALEAGVDALIGQAMLELWNRLRIVAESHHRDTRMNIFTRKAPSIDGFVMPRFLAALLSGIGPLRVQDTFRDTIIIYAPPQATRDNFGRQHPAPVDAYACNRMLAALRASQISLAAITTRGSIGAFFTTCSVQFQDVDSFEVIGAFHQSHYNRNDIAMALVFGNATDDEHPFENLFVTMGFIDDEDAIEAFTQAPPPEHNIPVLGPSRHIGGTFAINEFGLAPASNVPEDGRPQGIYVLGRGREIFAACSLARELSQFEINNIIRYRILHGPGAPNHADGAPAPPAPAPAAP